MSLNNKLESISSESDDRESDYAGDKDDGEGRGDDERNEGSDISLGF